MAWTSLSNYLYKQGKYHRVFCWIIHSLLNGPTEGTIKINFKIKGRNIKAAADDVGGKCISREQLQCRIMWNQTNYRNFNIKIYDNFCIAHLSLFLFLEGQCIQQRTFFHLGPNAFLMRHFCRKICSVIENIYVGLHSNPLEQLVVRCWK